MSSMTYPLVLSSLDNEMRNCYSAVNDLEHYDLAVFIHHEMPLEMVDYGGGIDRVAFISGYKDRSERRLRFRMFRPFNMRRISEYFVGHVEFQETLKAFKREQIKAKYHRSKFKALQKQIEYLNHNTPEAYVSLLQEVEGEAAEQQSIVSNLEGVLYSFLRPSTGPLYVGYMEHFERLWGVPWNGDIFNTFPHITEEDKLASDLATTT